MAYSFRANELRVVLIGRTGSGKSSSGNTLTGNTHTFKAKQSPVSVTRVCQVGKSELPDGRTLVAVDTPGFFDTDILFQNLATDISKCVTMSSPGPHAFLLVLQPGRYTPEERKSVEMFLKIFGSKVERHLIVVFTHADELDGSIDEFIKMSEDLKNLMKICKNRKFAIDNVNKSKRKRQVQQLVTLIDNMVRTNGGSVYTNEMYTEQKKLLEEQERELKRKMEREERERTNALKRKISDKYKSEISAHKEREASLRNDIEAGRKRQRTMETIMGKKSREAEESRNYANDLSRQIQQNNREHAWHITTMQDTHRAEQKAQEERMQREIEELRNRPPPPPVIVHRRRRRKDCSIQ